jgi:hypothetical protein
MYICDVDVKGTRGFFSLRALLLILEHKHACLYTSTLDYKVQIYAYVLVGLHANMHNSPAGTQQGVNSTADKLTPGKSRTTCAFL